MAESTWLTIFKDKVNVYIRTKTKPRSITKNEESELFDDLADKIYDVFKRCPGINYFYIYTGNSMVTQDVDGKFVYTNTLLKGLSQYLIEPVQLGRKLSPRDGDEVSYNSDTGSFTILDPDFALDPESYIIVWVCGIQVDIPPVSLRRVRYDYVEQDPIEQLSAIQLSLFKDYLAMDNEIEITLPVEADQKYLVFQFPVDEEPFLFWNQGDLDSGVIPDFAFREMVEVAGKKYIVTRNTFNLDINNPKIKFRHA